MVSITFFADGSHVHQRGRPEEKRCRRDCDESRRIKDVLDVFKPESIFFERVFRNFDRRMESFAPTNRAPIKARVHRPNLEEKSGLCRSALMIGMIATSVLGVGYLGYQNAETIKNAGEAAWTAMQSAWDRAFCRNYHGAS